MAYSNSLKVLGEVSRASERFAGTWASSVSLLPWPHRCPSPQWGQRAHARVIFQTLEPKMVRAVLKNGGRVIPPTSSARLSVIVNK